MWRGRGGKPAWLLRKIAASRAKKKAAKDEEEDEELDSPSKRRKLTEPGKLEPRGYGKLAIEDAGDTENVGSGGSGSLTVSLQVISKDRFSASGKNTVLISNYKSIVGAMLDESIGAWTFPISQIGALEAKLSRLPNVKVNGIPTEVMNILKKVKERRMKAAQLVEEYDFSNIPHELLYTLLPFQLRGVKFALQNGGKALICDEMGLGKTIQAVAVACCFKKEWPVLVIVPALLKHQWAKEFQRWLPELAMDVYITESARDATVGKVTIVSYDLVPKMKDTLFKKHSFQVIICDESHYIKSLDAQRTQAIVPLLKAAPRRILLTGTPALSRPAELFPQLDSVGGAIFSSFKKFGQRYCGAFQGPNGWDYSGSSNLQELHMLLRETVMVRRLKADVLSDLPEKKRQLVYVEPSPEDMEEINQKMKQAGKIREKQMMFGGGPGAQNSIITELFKETGAAKIKSIQKYLTKLLEELDKNFEEERAKQTAETAAQPGKPKRRLLPATFATSVDGDDIIDDDPEEAETMVKKSLIAKAPQKFLVFAHHLVVLDAVEDLMKSKGVGYIRIDGSTPAKARATSVELFARHPSTRVAILSMTAASTGINMVAASIVIFAELFWNPGTLIQAEDRCHRIGQRAPFVAIRYLLAKKTVDDVIWPLIGRKLGVVGSALNGQRDFLAVDKVSAHAATAITPYDLPTDPIQSLEDASKDPKQPTLQKSFATQAKRPPTSAPSSAKKILQTMTTIDYIELDSEDFAPRQPRRQTSQIHGMISAAPQPVAPPVPIDSAQRSPGGTIMHYFTKPPTSESKGIQAEQSPRSRQPGKMIVLDSDEENDDPIIEEGVPPQQPEEDLSDEDLLDTWDDRVDIDRMDVDEPKRTNGSEGSLQTSKFDDDMPNWDLLLDDKPQESLVRAPNSAREENISLTLAWELTSAPEIDFAERTQHPAAPSSFVTTMGPPIVAATVNGTDTSKIAVLTDQPRRLLDSEEQQPKPSDSGADCPSTADDMPNFDLFSANPNAVLVQSTPTEHLKSQASSSSLVEEYPNWSLGLFGSQDHCEGNHVNRTIDAASQDGTSGFVSQPSSQAKRKFSLSTKKFA